jgi:hypothetical protein
MKHLLAFLLLPSLLLGEPPAPVDGSEPFVALPETYEVRLTLLEKGRSPVEIAVLVASKRFHTDLGDQGIIFEGNITPEASGSFVVVYAIGWETPSRMGQQTIYLPSSTEGSVRLKLGEEHQIFRSGTRTARLTIKPPEVLKAIPIAEAQRKD